MAKNKHQTGDASVSKFALTLFAHPPLLMWAAYLVMSAFYINPSGTAQPGDFVLLALFLVLAVTLGTRTGVLQTSPFRRIVVFVIYIAAVSLFWTSFGYLSFRFLLFYVFNALAFVSALLLYERYRRSFLLVTAYGTIFSLVLQMLLWRAGFANAGQYRSTLFFNNPNQLGYYALMGATIVMVGGRYLRISGFWSAAGFVAATALTMLSLSKAALVSLIILGMLSAVRRLSITVLAAVALFGMFYLTDFGPGVVEKVNSRLSNIGDQVDDSARGRGYDRIINHPEYLLFGAGEGSYYRFESAIPGEMHSTLGSLFFSYGFLGLALFLWFVFSLGSGAPIGAWLVFAPAFLYGLTHNGIRSTLLWIFFAYLYCLLCEDRLEGGDFRHFWALRHRVGAGVKSATTAAERALQV